MKRTDLHYIASTLASLKPDARTAPVIETTEWRRIVVALGVAFARSPWRHLHDHDAFLDATGAATPEPLPRPDEPYELDGAWYNLTESEATARGLVQDPSAPRWYLPRNIGTDGQPIMDVSLGQMIDAMTGEWRMMTRGERVRYSAPPEPVDAINDPVEMLQHPPPRSAYESAAHNRRGYCGETSPVHPVEARSFSCTREPGHAGVHEAVTDAGRRYCDPWVNTPPSILRGARLTPAAVRAAAQAQMCRDEYEDEEGDVHTCTEVRGHDDDASRNYDPDLMHSDGDITW